MILQIRLGEDARRELLRVPTYARRRIVAAMKRELAHDPLLERAPRKRLEPDPEADIRTTAPVWRLRIGDHRVYYDVDSRQRIVMVQRIAYKGRRTTRETLE